MSNLLKGEEMTGHKDIAKELERRLKELTVDIAEIDAELQHSLSADWEEQATQLEGQDALGGIEKAKLQEAAEIRKALQRISLGTYGICKKCGEPIDAKRLKALPTAARCIACAGSG